RLGMPRWIRGNCDRRSLALWLGMADRRDARRRRRSAIGGGGARRDLRRALGIVHHLKERRQLSDVAEPLPALTGEADLIVALHLALDDPLLQRGDLFEREDMTARLSNLPIR